MESKGRLISLYRDWKTKKFQAVFELDTANEEESLNGDLRITVRKWREKRSLDANAYMWVLIQEIAVQTDSTKDEVYERLIQNHGLRDRDENGFITVTLRADIDISHLPGHWELLTATPEWKAYRRIRGTSEYDTKEMSYFLDRVIEEAKALGVETMTPDELRRIKSYEF